MNDDDFIENESDYYFVHSFYCKSFSSKDVLFKSNYGFDYCASSSSDITWNCRSRSFLSFYKKKCNLIHTSVLSYLCIVVVNSSYLIGFTHRAIFQTEEKARIFIQIPSIKLYLYCICMVFGSVNRCIGLYLTMFNSVSESLNSVR